MSTEVKGNDRKTVDAILTEQVLTGKAYESIMTKLLRAVAKLSGSIGSPPKKLVFAGVFSATSAATSNALTLTGLLSTDTVIATLTGQGAAEVLQKAVPTTNTLTFTWSAAATVSTTKVSYSVYR